MRGQRKPVTHGRAGRVGGFVRLVMVPVLVAYLLIGVVAAGPAAADQARPGDTRSVVLTVSPAIDGVEARILGGDAFIELRVARGVEVEVPGYQQEPYLRVRADGIVERNANSPAVALNVDRYGVSDLPPGDADAPAAWDVIGDGGVVRWHDHRVHWMGAQAPPGVSVIPWSLELTANGSTVTVAGELRFLDAPNMVPVVVLVVAGAVAVGLVTRWRAGRKWSALLVALAAAAVAVAWAAAAWSVPAEVGRRWAPPALGLIAVLCGFGAWRSRHDVLRGAFLASAGVALGVAGVVQFDVVRHAVLPWPFAPAVQRAAVVVALAIALGVLAATVPALLTPARPLPSGLTDSQ